MLHSVLSSDIEATTANKDQRGAMDEVKFDPERLVKAMKQAKLGDTKLAEKVGISRQMIYLLRKGKRPSASAEIIAKIANATNTTVSYLMGGEENDDAPPIQKLPEPIRQLAEVAGQLSEVRQEELLRIAHALRQLEAEQATAPLPGGTMRALIELADQIRAQGNNDDLLESLRALFRSPPRGWFLDGLPRGQGPKNPDQSH